MSQQPCVDMRKDDQGQFVHHPETTRFYNEEQPTKVLLETRCGECALILSSVVIDKSEDTDEVD